MTNHWVDIKNANVVVVMGGNAAEAHPVGFRWAMEAKNNNNATLIVVDPRFTRTASVADIYAPIRSGTDITFLSGVLLYLIENNKINAEYVKHYTNASLLVRDDFAFEEGLFSGYDAEKRQYDKSSWNYQFDENGYAKRDETLSHPRCVWSLLKQSMIKNGNSVTKRQLLYWEAALLRERRQHHGRLADLYRKWTEQGTRWRIDNADFFVGNTLMGLYA